MVMWRDPGNIQKEEDREINGNLYIVSVLHDPADVIQHTLTSLTNHLHS